jgi:hypothetical protein
MVCALPSRCRANPTLPPFRFLFAQLRHAWVFSAECAEPWRINLLVYIAILTGFVLRATLVQPFLGAMQRRLATPSGDSCQRTVDAIQATSYIRA